MIRYRLALCILILGFISCGNQDGARPTEETRFLMDTAVRISVYGQGMPDEKVRKAVDQAFQKMAEIEARTSIHIDTSEVSRIVENGSRGVVPVSQETRWLFKKSMEISEKTGGAFDVTTGLVKALWGFDSDDPHVPNGRDMEKALRNVDYRFIQFEDGGVLLRRSGMRIDLGGIAKGYIVDRAVEVLQEAGIQAGLVDAGGDMQVFGDHPKRHTWRIGIRHPRAEAGELLGVIETEEAAVASSGDYERCFFQDGRRYHHILDPRTGFPAEGCVSVTIVAENALLADGYATAVFVLGPEKGMALIERLPEIEGLIVYESEGKLQTVFSEGLRGKVQMMNSESRIQNKKGSEGF